MARKRNLDAENLRKAHVVLLGDLQTLEQVVRPSSGYSSEDLALLHARLGATHAHICEHFRFEEQNGYMEAVRRREPHLERTILQLGEEHVELKQSLAAILEEAEAARSVNDSLREKVRQWIEHVRRHESRENELVQAAFNLDVGPED